MNELALFLSTQFLLQLFGLVHFLFLVLCTVIIKSFHYTTLIFPSFFFFFSFQF